MVADPISKSNTLKPLILTWKILWWSQKRSEAELSCLVEIVRERQEIVEEMLSCLNIVSQNSLIKLRVEFEGIRNFQHIFEVKIFLKLSE